MSDQTIRAGDLVYQVRCTHACLTEYMGIPFIVDRIVRTSGTCAICKTRIAPNGELGAWGGNGPIIVLAWLKKLNPPAQDETTECEKEAHA